MVHVEHLETMNLLGLITWSLLERNLENPAKARRIARSEGRILVRADRMRITLWLHGGNIRILRGEQPPSDAYVEGSLGALLDIALGRGLIVPAIRGEVRAGGRIGLLLRLLPLLRVNDG
jgi:hypothetical protein